MVGEVENKLKEIIHDVCVEINVDIIEPEIMPDHVHLLIEVDPQYGVQKAIKLIKGRSSFILRKEFKELTTKLPILWTNSYFISTAEGVP